VSIHFNCSPRRAADGVETYYYDRRSAPLASNILREIATCYGSHSRGVKYARFYVLHHNQRPATLLELGFVSNARENSKLQDPRVRQTPRRAHRRWHRQGARWPGTRNRREARCEVSGGCSCEGELGELG